MRRGVGGLRSKRLDVDPESHWQGGGGLPSWEDTVAPVSPSWASFMLASCVTIASFGQGLFALPWEFLSAAHQLPGAALCLSSVSTAVRRMARQRSDRSERPRSREELECS